MTKFKIGDRVRVTERYYKKGKIGIVKAVRATDFMTVDKGTASQTVDVKLDEEKGTSQFFDVNLELIAYQFNVATATDQELADEFRRLTAERTPLWDELERRGYKLYSNVGMVNVRAQNHVFKKKPKEIVI